MKAWWHSLLYNQRYGVWPAVAWLAVTVVLLTLPGRDIPSVSFLSKIYFDKWVHIGMFALLTGLFCKYAVAKISRRRLTVIFLAITLLALLYGIAMEYVQRDYIPNRSFDFGDILADAGGALLALVICIKVYAKK